MFEYAVFRVRIVVMQTSMFLFFFGTDYSPLDSSSGVHVILANALDDSLQLQQ